MKMELPRGHRTIQTASHWGVDNVHLTLPSRASGIARLGHSDHDLRAVA
jgi:hypothetical protein